MQAAIEKLIDEIQKNNNPYVQVIGRFLIDHVNANSSSAEKILANDKTIIGSLDEMRKEAEKVKVNNCAVLTDQQGFAIVLEYFGIDGVVTLTTMEKPTLKPKVKQKERSQKVVPLHGNNVQASLFDFIEES
jgi:hypothetical protein